MKLVLITGARGFIGRHVARCLAKLNYKAIGTGHGAWSGAPDWGLDDWLVGEVDAANLDILAERHGAPEFVVHLAGGATVGASIRSPLEDFQRTALTTVRLLEWIRLSAPAAQVMAASSAAVYGSGHPGPIAETASLNPYSPYGTHKLILEELFRSYSTNFGLQTLLLRLFSVFGEGLEKQVLWDLCTKLRDSEGAELGGSGDEQRDWVHVEDVARLFELSMTHADSSCPVFNGASGKPHSMRELVSTVKSEWGDGLNVRFSGQKRSGDPYCLTADTSLVQRVMGFQPEIDPVVGFRRYVNWFRTHFLSP